MIGLICMCVSLSFALNSQSPIGFLYIGGRPHARDTQSRILALRGARAIKSRKQPVRRKCQALLDYEAAFGQQRLRFSVRSAEDVMKMQLSCA